MMKKQVQFLFFLLTAGLFVGCDNSPKHNPPPLERARLTVRFFEALEKDDPAAGEVAVKLRALLPENNYLRTLAETRSANAFLQQANRFLKEGKLKEAAEAITEGLRRDPVNQPLREASSQIANLREIDRNIRDMNLALGNSTELLSALSRLEECSRRFRDRELQLSALKLRQAIQLRHRQAQKEAAKAAKELDSSKPPTTPSPIATPEKRAAEQQ
ncbi:MAG: hypothetical protein PHS41_04990 [Victivallaceae bacterium]|nr:hypothetical protein [Victivallaceae bacterium]